MKVSRKLIGGSIVLAALALLATPASALTQCFIICTPESSCDQACLFNHIIVTCRFIDVCTEYSAFVGQEDSNLSLGLPESEALTEAAVNDDALIEPSTGPTDPNRDVVQPEVP